MVAVQGKDWKTKIYRIPSDDFQCPWIFVAHVGVLPGLSIGLVQDVSEHLKVE